MGVVKSVGVGVAVSILLHASNVGLVEGLGWVEQSRAEIWSDGSMNLKWIKAFVASRERAGQCFCEKEQ